MSLRDEMCFVQFIHPGKEHRPDIGRLSKSWNTGAHKRKFVENNGQCISRGERYDGLLRFWTEWEPESKVVAEIAEPVPNGPRFVYRPFYVVPHSYRSHQNTDPFVFGSFFYKGCQQNTKRGPTQLRFLSQGSVVLFGSCVTGKFAIDTVFVVDKWEDHDERDFSKLRDHVSETYWDVTLAAWYRSSDGETSCSPRKHRPSCRLYYGATIDRPVSEMFSFFPCTPAAHAPNGFARPTITIPTLINRRYIRMLWTACD